MIRHQRNTGGNTGYAKLYSLLKENEIITTSDNALNELKGVIAGAAIHYFSTLSPQEQFEAVAGYMKDVEDMIVTKKKRGFPYTI